MSLPQTLEMVAIQLQQFAPDKPTAESSADDRARYDQWLEDVDAVADGLVFFLPYPEDTNVREAFLDACGYPKS